MDEARILASLNKKQRAAVRCTDGPLLVIAGPGSGKTRVLTTRIAYLIASGRATPGRILALTFTNKAAREMTSRVTSMVPGGAARGLAMGSFHSVMARMLRIELRQEWLAGFNHNFSIYDTDDADRVVRQLMEERHLDRKQTKPRSIRNAISRAKNSMILPNQYAETVKSPFQEQVSLLYGPYQEALRANNAMDFDDLLLVPLELFRKVPEILKKYQRKWKYVLIDEFQDTNRIQYLLADHVAQHHRNLCVVGDDAQSIYAFRGADMRNILDFQTHYADATVVFLEQNYRSTKTIVRLADSIIKHNKEQLHKDLWTGNDQGHKVTLITTPSGQIEALRATDCIREHHEREGIRYSDCAVLYRTNQQSREFEDALRRVGVPYRVVGGLSFYQRKEVKDALAYLRLLVNPDDDVAFSRIINYPSRGIGLKTQAEVKGYARSNDISLWSALLQRDCMRLRTAAVRALDRFATFMGTFKRQLSSTEPDVLARELLKEAGLFADLGREKTPKGEGRIKNVQELITAIRQYVEQERGATLYTFLQYAALFTDADERDVHKDRVSLMTLHASKGLEFKVVFIGGLEEEFIPGLRVLEQPELLEEERRLLYVGVTRAEERLYLSHAEQRHVFGDTRYATPSQFLEQMDTRLVRQEGRTFRRYYPTSQASPVRPLRRGAIRSARSPRARAAGSNGDEYAAIVAGARVHHAMYGAGLVLRVEGRGPRKVASVLFKEHGQKRMMVRFARLRVL